MTLVRASVTFTQVPLQMAVVLSQAAAEGTRCAYWQCIELLSILFRNSRAGHRKPRAVFSMLAENPNLPMVLTQGKWRWQHLCTCWSILFLWQYLLTEFLAYLEMPMRKVDMGLTSYNLLYVEQNIHLSRLKNPRRLKHRCVILVFPWGTPMWFSSRELLIPHIEMLLIRHFIHGGDFSQSKRIICLTLMAHLPNILGFFPSFHWRVSQVSNLCQLPSFLSLPTVSRTFHKLAFFFFTDISHLTAPPHYWASVAFSYSIFWNFR